LEALQVVVGQKHPSMTQICVATCVGEIHWLVQSHFLLIQASVPMTKPVLFQVKLDELPTFAASIRESLHVVTPHLFP
jgi:hypothetical protein